MNKNKILKGVSETYNIAISMKNQVDSLTKAEIWDIHSQEERDTLVIILQNLEKSIADIVDVESKIVCKRKIT